MTLINLIDRPGLYASRNSGIAQVEYVGEVHAFGYSGSGMASIWSLTGTKCYSDTWRRDPEDIVSPRMSDDSSRDRDNA